MGRGRQVTAEWTYATPAEAIVALSEAHEAIFGERPTASRLLILAAQSALETGRWHRMRNWSVGGVKASPSGPRDYATYMTSEVINGKEVKIQQHFRAFPDLMAGMADWVEFLRQPRFAAALERADAYDAIGYADELKAQRYFTADSGSYGRGVRSLSEEFERLPLDWASLTITTGEAMVASVVAQATKGDGS